MLCSLLIRVPFASTTGVWWLRGVVPWGGSGENEWMLRGFLIGVSFRVHHMSINRQLRTTTGRTLASGSAAWLRPRARNEKNPRKS